MTAAELFAEPLELPDYLQRIEYSGPVRPTVAVLTALHLAHATHIPFENLDALMGRGIRLDLASLQAKLVVARRGGYCFEQNLLFAAALRAVGFSITPLAARVRYRTHRVLPRTHMLLLVSAEGSDWLADVGFGGEGLLQPIPFAINQPVVQDTWTYRVMNEGPLWVLQSRQVDGWLDLYSFNLEPQQWVDYEVANYYVSTHPESRFTQMLTVQRTTPEARYILRNREFTIDRGTSAQTRRLVDDAEIIAILASTFDLHLPAGTGFDLREPRDVDPSAPAKP